MTHSNMEQEARSILLIDGGRESAMRMQGQFDRGGVLVKLYFVEDGEEAISFLLRAEPHTDAPRPVLIFLDMRLSDGGFEMLAMAKNDRNFARIPIIVFSLSENGEVEKAYSLHANCCVRRPQSAEELVQFVDFVRKFWLELITLGN